MQIGIGIGISNAARGASGPSYGPELLANGGFDSDTVWSKGVGWTIGSGVASFSNPTGTLLAQTVATLPAGKTYQVEFDLTITAGLGCQILLSGGGGSDAGGGTLTGTGRKTATITTTINRTIFNILGLGNAVLTIDNVSLREVL